MPTACVLSSRLSGNCRDDLTMIKGLVPDLLRGLLYTDGGVERDLRLALGTFIDIPEVRTFRF